MLEITPDVAPMVVALAASPRLSALLPASVATECAGLSRSVDRLAESVAALDSDSSRYGHKLVALAALVEDLNR